MNKLLLLNFTQAQIDKVSKRTGKTVHQGLLQTDMDFVTSSDGLNRSVPDTTTFFSPDSFYEYEKIFILLDNAAYTATLKQSDGVSDEWKQRDSNALVNYVHSGKGQVVFFIGESNYETLDSLGIGVTLSDASKADKLISYIPANTHDTAFRRLLDATRNDIALPLSKYVQFDNRFYQSSNSPFVRNMYVNANEDSVGAYLDYVGYTFEDDDKPRLLIMPMLKHVPDFIVKLSESLVAKQEDEDWQTSFEYLPNGIEDFKGRIEVEKQRHEAANKLIKAEVTAYMQKYEKLTHLLTESGDELVDAVEWALGNIIGLEVTNSDTLLKKGSRKEDLTIKHEGQFILAEVKGVNSKNPSPKYFSQLATHYALNRNTTDVKGLLLILNYDSETMPETRPLAYTGEYEQLMDENFAFLDTRVLHKITKEVIDGNLTQDEAKVVVLSGKRITY